MVKSDKPLQIRLTEPVIFLKGPSTGLDFRGRPQVVRADAQPAMLRGLLTLRLNKATRIRKIEVKLEGKTRTEWPEGIGPKRSDTLEEHEIISETSTYFDGMQHDGKHKDIRRTASIGPGIASQWDLEEGGDMYEEDSTDSPYHADTLNGYDGSRGRHPISGLPRSASAMPGMDELRGPRSAVVSRRTSLEDNNALSMNTQASRERGPSPAYTPRPEFLPAESSRRSSLRGSGAGTPSHEPTLSPIASAPASRSPSDRDGSTSTERRLPIPSRSRSQLAEEIVVENEDSPGEGASPRDTPVQVPIELADNPADTLTRPSILGTEGPRQSGGEVRFAPTTPSVNGGETPNGDSGDTDKSEGTQARTRRASSIMSTASHLTTSSRSSHEPTSERHPVLSAINTAYNSPAPSAPPSIRDFPSSDYLPLQSISAALASQAQTQQDEAGGQSTNHSDGSSLHQISRQSSLQPRELSPSLSPEASTSPTSTVPPPSATSTTPPEIRQGRKSRIGSTSTIVFDRNAPGPSRPSGSGGESAQRSVSGLSLSSLNNHLPALPHLPHRPHLSKSGTASRDVSPDGRGRPSKFSLSHAFDGLIERIGSRSQSRTNSRTPRSRAASRASSPPPPVPALNTGSATMSRTGSGGGQTRTPAGLAIPPHLREDEPRGRRDGRAHSREEVPTQFGRGGAGRAASRSRDRTISPPRASRREGRSPSRNRGRHVGMKVLTDALGLGEHHDGPHTYQEADRDDVHNWKEFKKGIYNYPISFPIPVDAPPTIHAEFGSVVYRLKATVKRVGALTTNLTEELEVVMISTPQEDDLEETENVVVERQWEEQMRYQITLSGKAFPIGGILPISVRLMPFMKCRIHRLTVALEEKTDYFAQGKKVARHETPKKYTLLFVKQPEKLERICPLLPVISDDPNAAKESPVAQLAAQAAMNNPSPDNFDPGNEDSVYASLLEPLGPWHLEQNLQIPDCTSSVKFTSKHEKTNISVGHWLKVTIRVERGDDEAVDTKGRRKQFDIIIETPIKILDCRVNFQYNSLPTYSTHNPGTLGALPGVCPIHGKAKHITPITSARTANSDALVSAAPSSRFEARDQSTSRHRRDHNAHHEDREDTLLERNITYDRLMSGQETEMGELPPTYGEAVASAIRSASRSASRQGRPGMVIRESGSGSQSRSRSRLGLGDTAPGGSDSRGRSALRDAGPSR